MTLHEKLEEARKRLAYYEGPEYLEAFKTGRSTYPEVTIAVWRDRVAALEKELANSLDIRTE